MSLGGSINSTPHIAVLLLKGRTISMLYKWTTSEVIKVICKTATLSECSQRPLFLSKKTKPQKKVL